MYILIHMYIQFTARVSLKMEGDNEWRLSAQYDSDNVSCLKASLKPSYEVVQHSSWKPCE